MQDPWESQSLEVLQGMTARALQNVQNTKFRTCPPGQAALALLVHGNPERESQNRLALHRERHLLRAAVCSCHVPVHPLLLHLTAGQERHVQQALCFPDRLLA